MLKKLGVFACLLAVVQVVLCTKVGFDVEEVGGDLQEKLARERDCVCMNWRNCHGSINSE